MDMHQPTETAGFAAIAGGHAESAALPAALEGLAHRFRGQLDLTALRGTEIIRSEHQGCLDRACALRLDEAPRGRLGLLAVGGGSAPLVASASVAGEPVAVCVTGRFHNGPALRRIVVERGALLRGESDAELLLHLMAHSRQRTLVNRLLEALERVVGAFSLALITRELMVAARDPRGFRPLWLGAVGPAHAAASDQEALEGMGVVGARELAAGEVALLEAGAPVRSLRPWGTAPRAACVQEWLGRARVTASFEGLSVHALRQRLGRALAAGSPTHADAVITLPGACPVAAMAFAKQAELPLVQAFDPLRLVGEEGLGRAVSAAVQGRRLALVFGSEQPLERVRQASLSLRAAGCTRVHLRSTAPLLSCGCPYGLQLPGAPTPATDRATLEAWLQVDSLHEIGLEGLAVALGRDASTLCALCLGAQAPLVERDAAGTPQLPLFEGEDPGTNAPGLV